MLLYFNGDSFTAGTELIDHTLPGFPGYKSKIESKKFDKDSWHATRNQYLASWRAEYFRQCKEICWCATLSKMVGADYINGAKGGSSLLGIMARTSADLLKLRDDGKIPDHVFIQLTSHYRTAIYNHAPTEEHFLTDDFVINNVFTADPDGKKKAYVEAWVDLENYNSLIFRWLHQLHLLCHTVKSITGKFPILVDSIFMTDRFQHELSSMRHFEVPALLLKDLGLLSKFDDRLKMITFFQHNEPVLPLGHFIKPVHDRFAESVRHVIFDDSVNTRLSHTISS